MVAQHLQALAKRSQHLNETDRNIVGCNMLHASGHSVATRCDMLRVENQTSAHAWAQHYCTNLAKRLQHHAWPHRNRVVKRTQHVVPSNVARCWVEMLRLVGRASGWPRVSRTIGRGLSDGHKSVLVCFSKLYSVTFLMRIWGSTFFNRIIFSPTFEFSERNEKNVNSTSVFGFNKYVKFWCV